MISKILVLALAAIAARVSVGQYKGRRMWVWIVSYWVVLTVKNVIDLISMM